MESKTVKGKNVELQCQEASKKSKKRKFSNCQNDQMIKNQRLHKKMKLNVTIYYVVIIVFYYIVSYTLYYIILYCTV